MVEFGDGQAEAIRKIFETEKWIVEAREGRLQSARPNFNRKNIKVRIARCADQKRQSR